MGIFDTVSDLLAPALNNKRHANQLESTWCYRKAEVRPEALTYVNSPEKFRTGLRGPTHSRYLSIKPQF